MAKDLKGKVVREPCEEKPYAWFDEGELEKQVTAARLFPTLHGVTQRRFGASRGKLSTLNTV
jgi:hypothetical protein